MSRLPTDADPELVKKALEQNHMDAVVTCRPADLIEPEWDKMVEESKKAGGDGSDEDVLTYAMFPNVAPKFFAERSKGPVDAAATFAKKEAAPAAAKENKGGSYTINVNGTAYNVTTGPAGDSMSVNVNGTAYNVTFGAAGAAPAASAAPAAAVVTGGVDVKAPVAGTLLRHAVAAGTKVNKGDTVIIIESMKMELEVKAPEAGTINFTVQPGTQIQAGQTLATLGGVVQAAPAQPAPAAAPAGAPPRVYESRGRRVVLALRCRRVRAAAPRAVRSAGGFRGLPARFVWTAADRQVDGIARRRPARHNPARPPFVCRCEGNWGADLRTRGACRQVAGQRAQHAPAGGGGAPGA